MVQALTQHLSYETTTFVEDAKEWHASRKVTVTGTDLSIIIGLNPWKKANTLAYEKINGSAPLEMNDAIIRGRILEPSVLLAIKHYLDIPARQATPTGTVQVIKRGNLAVSLDGIVEINGEIIPVECKTTTCNSLSKYWKTKPPVYYMIQLYAQMMAVGASHGYIAGVAIDHDEILFTCYKMKHDKKLSVALTKEIDKFYKTVIIGREEYYAVNEELKAKVKAILPDLMEKVR